MSNVYVMEEDGTSAAMSRLRCRCEDRELQQLLENNHKLLPGDQMNPEDPRRWLLIKREIPVPDPCTGCDRWSIDFLFGDQDGVPTFVECKRFADTRSRREVVGQMIEYAANGHHDWDREYLQSLADETASGRGTTLEALIAEFESPASGSIEEYFARMENNLREGQLRIVFFMDESPGELRSITEFLNRQMERSEILLVEARQYLSGTTRIIVPTLFGCTEEARSVKRTVSVNTADSRR
jgi:hypothetical protein